jgi:hypothetical protein
MRRCGRRGRGWMLLPKRFRCFPLLHELATSRCCSRPAAALPYLDAQCGTLRCAAHDRRQDKRWSMAQRHSRSEGQASGGGSSSASQSRVLPWACCRAERQHRSQETCGARRAAGLMRVAPARAAAAQPRSDAAPEQRSAAMSASGRIAFRVRSSRTCTARRSTRQDGSLVQMQALSSRPSQRRSLKSLQPAALR